MSWARIGIFFLSVALIGCVSTTESGTQNQVTGTIDRGSQKRIEALTEEIKNPYL